MLQGLATDLAVLGALLLLGVVIVRAILESPSRLEIASLSFPMGAGLYTLAVFVIGWLGFKYTVPSAITVYLALLTAGVGIRLLSRRRKANASKRQSTPGGPSAAEGFGLPNPILVVFAVLFVLEAYLAVGRSYSTWDAAAMWSVKGYGIALEGSIFAGERWGAHALAYPLNIHLLISLFKLGSGDLLPGSKLIFPLFQASLLLGCVAFWLRRSVRTTIALLGLLVLATVPVFVLHATLGFANLPMTCYLVLGAIWGIQGIFENSPKARVLSGILLGLASWTIVEGFLFSTAIVMSLVGARWLAGRGKLDPITWLLPFVVVSGAWMAFYLSYGASGSQAMGAVRKALASITEGDLNLTELRLIFGYLRRYIFRLDIWGLIFPVGILLFILNWRSFSRSRSPDLIAGLFMFSATGLLTLMLFYLRSFVVDDFLALLERGFPRGFLQTAFLFAITVFLSTRGSIDFDADRKTEPLAVS